MNQLETPATKSCIHVGLDVHKRTILLLAFDGQATVPASKLDDGLHLALSVYHGMDFLVSWNFDHMVAVKTKQRLPVLAAQNGYFKIPLLVSPVEFTGRP